MPGAPQLQPWIQGDPITHSRLNDMIDAINALRLEVNQLRSLTPPANQPAAQMVRVKIYTPISGQRGRYVAKLLTGIIKQKATGNIAESHLAYDVDASTTYSQDVVVWNICQIATGGGVPLKKNSILHGRAAGRNSENKPIILVQSATGLFPARLTQNGGAQGSKTTAPTYTYNVADLDNASLGTAIAVSRPRPKGRVDVQSPGSVGWVYYDETGTLKIWDAGEVPKGASC